MPSISVIHLGLIYDIEILENNTVVKITHTLTSAFCPMADEINQDIQTWYGRGYKRKYCKLYFSTTIYYGHGAEETKMIHGVDMITLTENAKNYLSDVAKDDFVTLGVNGGGCSWFSICLGLQEKLARCKWSEPYDDCLVLDPVAQKCSLLVVQ